MSANKVYFAQHGLAVDKSENPERPLSEAGIQQTIAIAKHLGKTGITINHIFHSGKMRAIQTAEIITTALSISSASTVDYLTPNDDVKRLAQDLNVNNALYVGHLPHLGKLTAYLVTGNENDNIIKFQNSAVVCLEKNEDDYQLRWYLTPELLGC